jgi:hypothetical protein
MRSPLTLAVALLAPLALSALPRTAHAIEGFPCLGDWGCADDEVCKLLCEKKAPRKKAAAPQPTSPMCGYDNPSAPNLYVKQFQVTNAGGKATYSVEVCHTQPYTKRYCVYDGVKKYDHNKKYLSEPISFHVGVYHHVAGSGPACDAKPDIAKFMGTLDGGCAGFNTGQVARPTGAAPAWAFAEPGCAVQETNETDNKAVERPDLRVRLTDRTSYGTIPRTTRSGVAVPLELCNDGGGTSGPVLLGLVWGQPTTAPATPPSGTPFNAYKYSGKTLGTLACQRSTWWFPSSGTLPAGSFAGWLVADPKLQLKDPKRGNNTVRFTYSVPHARRR